MEPAEEWTGEWLQKLDHKFGDDGSFWISYEDLLRKYQAFDRTRLFGPEWKVASIWTTLDISWKLDYHDTKFAFSLARSGPVVIVFSQLDERYFKGLEGQYRFELSFRVHHRAGVAGAKEESSDYVVRSQNYYRMNRSVNVELDLDAGEYVVVVKVDAQRNERVMPVEEVVRAHAKDRREKLQRIGLAYDVAHSKGKIFETAEEKEAREAYEKRKGERERRRIARLLRERRQAAREAALHQKRRERRRREKAEARAQAKAERKAARREARRKAEEEEEKDSKEQKDKAESKEKCEGEKNCEEKEGGKKESRSEKTHAVVAEDKKSETVQTGADSKTENISAETPTDKKHVEADQPLAADGGSVSSNEPGENTPVSSAASNKESIEGEEPPDEEEAYVTAVEEEAYVTAIEEDTDDKRTPSAKESPSTPKPAQPPGPTPKTKSTPERIDVGVQTGPQLPPPPPPRRGPPPPHMFSPPPPGMGPPPPHHPGYGPPPRGMPPPMMHGPEFGRMPMHMRAAWLQRARAPSETELSTSDSESDLEGEATADDVSEVSEHDIDVCLADRARAARAAAAAAAAASASAKSHPPPGPVTSASEEPLDEFEKDPWNAVGVFGLRVYYKVPEARADGEAEDEEEVVKLRVERPNPLLWDESSDDEADDEKEDDNKGESKMLDVDDSAKDAVGEQPPTPSPEGSGKEEEGSKEDIKKEVKEEPQEESEEKSKEEGKDAPSGNFKIEEDAEKPAKETLTNSDVRKEGGAECQNVA